MMIMNRCFLLLFFLVLLIGNVYAITINEITITPDLDISYFGRYQIDANITEYSGNDVNLLVSAINGDGGTCWDYFVDGTCSSETPSTYSMDYNETTGFWHYDRVYPDTIYPEIIFIDSPTNWNNAPSWVNLWRQNYHIFKMYNSFEMDSNMNLWIEFNTEPVSTNNSGDLFVYVVGAGVPLSYFTSDWRDDSNTQLVGTISRNTAFNHDHTPSTHYVRHHLIPITANPDGTIGTNHVNISDGNFYIVLYQDSTATNRGWNLAYKPTSLCDNTDNWFTANRTGGNWNLPIHRSGCSDAHIHFARRETYNDGVNLEVTAVDGEDITTLDVNYYFAELPNLAPNETSFITPIPLATYDTNSIELSWNPATDPNNDDLTYDINYMDSDGNIFVIDNNFTDTNISWDVSALEDGNYLILGSVCDTEPLCTDFNLSDYFYINRSEPIYSLSTITIASNYFYTDYAKVGSQINLSFISTGTLSEDLNVIFYANGVEVTGDINVTNNTNDYNATYVIQEEDDDGIVGFTISATNLDYDYFDTTDDSYVTIDNTIADQDQDNIPDANDTFVGSLGIVETEGIDDLNITIDDDTNIVGIFTGVQTIKIYDAQTPILEFDHNFSESTLDLSLINIIKTNTGVVVDLNGQLQDDQNKTIYLENNNFISLCVENEPITSLSDISSNCLDANEYDFTECLSESYSSNGIDCVLNGNLITVSNLRYSGILGTVRTTSGGNSISKEADDTEEIISEINTDTENTDNNPIIVTPEDKDPEYNVVSSDSPDYKPNDEMPPIDYSRKSKNTTTIWIITYLICAIIVGITIYLFTKIRY